MNLEELPKKLGDDVHRYARKLRISDREAVVRLLETALETNSVHQIADEPARNAFLAELGKPGKPVDSLAQQAYQRYLSGETREFPEPK